MGASCTVDVTFTPTQAGQYAASLNISVNEKSGTTVVPLSGTGISIPVIAVNPTSLDFGQQLYNVASDPLTVTVNNTGSASLSITKVEIVNPANSTTSPFALQNLCPSTLQAKQAGCKLNVSFTPPKPTGNPPPDKPFTASLQITSNAATSPTTINLTGTGTEKTKILQFAGTSDGPGYFDGPTADARFNKPTGVAMTVVNNKDVLYVTDAGSSVVRKIADGQVTTLAGSFLNPGQSNGTSTAAQFNGPTGIAVDGTDVYVADTENQVIRLVNASQQVTKVAGVFGQSGTANGDGNTSQFNRPQGLAVVPTDGSTPTKIYVADTDNSAIRLLTKGSTSTSVTTFAGQAGSAGYAVGNGSQARFNKPTGITSKSGNGFYVSDAKNQTISEITANGDVSLYAGQQGVEGYSAQNPTKFSSPAGLAMASNNNLILADSGNNAVRYSAIGTSFNSVGGTKPNTQPVTPDSLPPLYTPTGIGAVPSASTIYVADPVGQTIQKALGYNKSFSVFGGVKAVYGFVNATGMGASFKAPSGIVADAAGNLYVADTENDAIRKITPQAVVTTFAIGFKRPSGLAIDGSGNLYVADTGNNTIRMVTPAGTVSTIAGTAGTAGKNNGTGTAATFNGPTALAVDPTATNLYVADTKNYMVRKINLSTKQVTTFAGTGQIGYEGGDPIKTATFGLIFGIAVDSTGTNVYVSDFTYDTIRRITSSTVTTIAGQAGTRGYTDGTGTVARFASPHALFIDVKDNMYVADEGNCLIRKVSKDTNQWTTVLGTKGTAQCKFVGSATAQVPSTINMVTGLVKVGSKLYFSAGNGIGLTTATP